MNEIENNILQKFIHTFSTFAEIQDYGQLSYNTHHLM
jgi:hypothetical protein